MSNKKFDAVLAKNRIARQLADHQRCGVPILMSVMLEDLKAIEEVISTANQPTAEDIFENNSKLTRSFVI